MTTRRECPDCGKTFDARAVECPGCGADPRPRQIQRATTTYPDPGRGTPESLAGGLLRIAATGEAIELSGRSQTILGRRVPDQRIVAALNPFDDVSRQHASITLYDREVEVADLNSTSGTYVGDELMRSGDTARYELPVILRLGSSCYVRLDRVPKKSHRA